MFNVGDEVLVKAKIKRVDETDTVRPYLVYIDEVLNNAWITADVLEGTKTYESGLNDAWEVAKKILYGNDRQLIEIFGLYVKPEFFDLTNKREIINSHTPEEALAKIDACEREKEIKVGDEVYGDDEPDLFGVVTLKDTFGTYVMWKDGSSGRDAKPESLHKTGKHIDIEPLLRQIGE